MAKDKITDYDATASNNLDVGGISVAEGMLPSGVNNSIRELMSHQKEAFGSGTPLYVDQTNNRVGVNNAAPATALDVTGSVNISNSSGATLKLTSTDTTGADTELLGQIDFVSSDSSGGSAGTQARIKGIYEDNGDSSGIAFLTGNSTGSGSPTINEVMRIRHEGRVGIGTASPSGVLAVTDGSNGLIVGQSTDNFHAANAHRFFTPAYAAERVRIDNDGLKFNGDTAQANALDDYEEGTWTVSTASSGYTISGTAYGRYTKIGRLVVVHFQVAFSAVGAQNSQVLLSTLPFTASSDLSFDGSVREQSVTGAIYVTRLGANSTNVTMNSMDGVNANSQRTIRTGEIYTGTLSYYTT